MRRRTGWILAGLVPLSVLVLALLAGWPERRPGIAPSLPREAPAALSPAASTTLLPRAQAGTRAPAAMTPGVEPIDPDETRCRDAWRQVVRQRTEQLATEPDADSQLAAALLDIGLPPASEAAIEAANARRHRRLAWALELAPGDPLLATQAYRLCAGDDRCDHARALDLLVRSDPDNAWTWVAVLARAQAAGDERGVERALERAARSSAARSYYGQTALRVLEPFGEPALPEACEGHVRRLEADLGRPATSADLVDVAIGANALQSLPALRPLLEACPSGLRDPHRRALCTRSLARGAAGETLYEQLLSTSRLVQLTAGTDAGPAWRERYRNLQWLQAQASERRLFERTPPLAWWAGGEVRVMEERLRAANAWPAPPGWLPEGAQARVLVRTGRGVPAR